MPNTNASQNMGMPVPVVGVDPGPDWATNINSCLTIIDGHTHTAGSGVPITPDAININADLPFNINNATTLRTVRFSAQSAPLVGASDLGCLYEQGVDLYYIDGSGNQVRITQGGNVVGSSGTITGLPSGTASASFAAATFTFQSATNTPAAMNFGPITMGQAVASGKNITISCAGAQPANYALTMPLSLPAAQATVASDSSGNLSFLKLVSGRYTPTTVTSTNVTSVSYSSSHYMCIDGEVSVVSQFDVTSSASGSTVVKFTLPIASNIAAATDVQGVFNHLNGAFSGIVIGDATNDCASITFNAPSGSTFTVICNFMYQIL